MKVNVRWLDGVSFEGENEAKHSFVMAERSRIVVSEGSRNSQ